MKKVLFIPHHPYSDRLKIRIVEIALGLSSRYDVFMLQWNAVEGEYTLLKRGLCTLKDLFKKARIYQHGPMKFVELPTMHRPISLGHRFNSALLNRFIEREHIDTVINGSYYLFGIPRQRNCTYVVDIADLPSSGAEDSFIDRYTREECVKADAITVVSPGLVDYVKSHYGREARFLPNGVSMKVMQAVTPGDVGSLREKYGIKNKFVFGYIGFIGQWVNVELVVNAFHIVKKAFPDSVLLWTGMSPNPGELERRFASDDVIFTGGIEGQIEPFFHCIDVGLLPHRKSPFQDVAFHLKLIEHTAAGKPVVSTKLVTSMNLEFKNIIFSDETAEAWAQAMIAARAMKRDKSWMKQAEAYDWARIAEQLEKIVEDSCK